MSLINEILENILMMIILTAGSMVIDGYAAGRTINLLEGFFTVYNGIVIIFGSIIFALYDRWFRNLNNN